jgi:DNA-binding NtrC family response regulator
MMRSQSGEIVFRLLISNEKIRAYLFDLLQRNQYRPQVSAGFDELLSALKGSQDAIVFLDSEAVVIYGAGIYSKIKATVPGGRIILLCDQAHREFVKVAMEHGSYGCILEPYAEWEALTIVRHILSDMQPKRRRPGKSRKKS